MREESNSSPSNALSNSKYCSSERRSSRANYFRVKDKCSTSSASAKRFKIVYTRWWFWLISFKRIRSRCCFNFGIAIVCIQLTFKCNIQMIIHKCLFQTPDFGVTPDSKVILGVYKRRCTTSIICKQAIADIRRYVGYSAKTSEIIQGIQGNPWRWNARKNWTEKI